MGCVNLWLAKAWVGFGWVGFRNAVDNETKRTVFAEKLFLQILSFFYSEAYMPCIYIYFLF